MSDVTAPLVLARVRELLDAVPYVVLATTDGSTVSARQVQPLAIDDDLVLWVGTSPRSRKVEEIGVTAGATVVVEHFESFAYASLECHASVIDDPAERTSRWIEDLAAFFPGGAMGDDFVLLRLEPRVVEIMDFAGAITPAPFGLVPAVIERVGDRWVLADHPRN